MESPNAALGPRRRRAAIVTAVAPALLLLVIAVWEIWAAAGAGSDMPGPDAWASAAKAVRERHEAGDLIVFAPRWIEPVGYEHLGDLMTVDMASRMDDARYGTVWELAVRGARAPEARGRTVTYEAEIAGISVRRLTSKPATVVTDFVARFGRDTSVSGPAVGRPAVKLEEVGFAPHRCVRVEPRPDGTVRIVYRNVALGTELVGYVGLADVFTRREIRDPGRLEVLIDGRPVATAEFGVDDGWVRFSAPTTPAQGAEVVFAATAVGPKARQRLICFAAEARS